MPATIERPIFREGQILGASDLQRSLDYARDLQARHARTSHTWGISSGLRLGKNANNEVELSAGTAVDSSGAEIVVPQTVKLDASQLEEQVGVTEKDDRESFPVFVTHTSKQGPTRASLTACGVNGSGRVTESYAIRFRRNATDWDTAPGSVAPPGGPDDSEESQRVVLLGFVRWNYGDQALDDFQLEKPPHRPRFVGVRADAVVGASGKLHLRSRPVETSDAPMIVLDQASEENTFVLGLDKGNGEARALLTVDAKGNVTAQGAFQGEVKVGAGQVLVQTGVATDGVKLPLPRTVTEQQVEDGNVTVHTTVTPRLDWSLRPADQWGPFVLESVVDAHRRVRCRIRWMKMGGDSVGPTFLDVTGAVDYTVIASVPPKEDEA